MNNNHVSQERLRLDFICNNDEEKSTNFKSRPPFSNFDQDKTSSKPFDSSQLLHRSSDCLERPCYLFDTYSRSCHCCGSVHFFYSEPNPASHFSTSQKEITQYKLPLNSGATFGAVSEKENKNHLSRRGIFKATLDFNEELVSPYAVKLNPPKNQDLENFKVEERVESENYSSPQSHGFSLNEEKDEHIRCLWAACSAEFNTRDELIPHLSSLHLGGRERGSKCKWEYCNSYSGGTDELLKHLYGAHLGIDEVKLTCQWENCKTQYSSFDDLTAHLSEGHVGSGRSSYVCGWTHCQRAGRPFNQRQKVMRHLQAHTGDKPYMCLVCEKRFAQSTVMSQHLRTHTGEKPYKCTINNCGKEFSIAGSLTGHLRTHSGEKPFSCKFQECKRQFSNSSNLTKHLRTHTGEKPFKCYNNPPCPKRFARPDQASRHMKVHANSQSRNPSRSLPHL